MDIRLPVRFFIQYFAAGNQISGEKFFCKRLEAAQTNVLDPVHRAIPLYYYFKMD